MTLKPCPFCGSNAELKYDSGNEVWGQSWQAKCTKCWAVGPKFMGSSSWRVVESEDDAAKLSAASAWNTRALATQEQPK